MRPRPHALALALACSPPSPAQAPRDDRDEEVRSEHAPISDADLARLDAAIADHAALYWRLRTADGPRCEPWTLEPDPDDPHRGRLVHSEAASRFSFAYQLEGGHLRLAAPTRERDTPVAPAAPSPETRVAAGTMTRALAFPCVFTGMSLEPADPAAPRRIVLASSERWFLDADACAAAGPDEQPQPASPGEIHPLGCASALADPVTRARDVGPVSPAAAPLRAARRFFFLRARGDAAACEVWHHDPADGDQAQGRLARSDRDEHGPRTLRYDYAVLGGTITLLGPTESRRVRAPDGPVDLTRTRGCLTSRPLARRDDLVLVGDDPWFLTRRACERARRAGVPPRPDLDCRPGHVPKTSP